MPLSIGIPGHHCVLPLPRLNLTRSYYLSIRRTCARSHSPPKWNRVTIIQRRQWPIFSVSGGSTNEAYCLTDDARSCPSNDEGPLEKTESVGTESFSTKEVLKRLKRYGISGVLSYGLLNTVYYITTFLVVWFYVAPVPGSMGYLAAAERFLKVMAMVWAGSQVTKLVRAGGALLLAPIVDRGLSWFTIKFNFQSQGKAFMAIAWFCFGLAVLLFLVVTLLWA